MLKLYLTTVLAVTMGFQLFAQAPVSESPDVSTSVGNFEKTGVYMSNNKTYDIVATDQVRMVVADPTNQVSAQSSLQVAPVIGQEDKRIVISAAEWDLQSERGKQYILEHPELYTVDPK